MLLNMIVVCVLHWLTWGRNMKIVNYTNSPTSRANNNRQLILNKVTCRPIKCIQHRTNQSDIQTGASPSWTSLLCIVHPIKVRDEDGGGIFVIYCWSFCYIWGFFLMRDYKIWTETSFLQRGVCWCFPSWLRATIVHYCFKEKVIIFSWTVTIGLDIDE